MNFFKPHPAQAGSLPSIPVFVLFAVKPSWIGVPVSPISFPSAGIVNESMEHFESARGFSPYVGTPDEDTLFAPEYPVIDYNGPIERDRFCDAYALRDAFDKVSSFDQFRAFIAACGPFQNFQQVRAHPDTASLEACRQWLPRSAVSWKQFQEWQALLTTARLTRSIPFWGLPAAHQNFSKYHINCEWSIRDFRSQETYEWIHWPLQEGQIYGTLSCETAVDAIAATIKLDILNGATWRECIHCKSVFKMGHKSERMFCDRTCKHAHGQQRRRETMKAQSRRPKLTIVKPKRKAA